MVDEKTVMASGPLNMPAAGPAPQSFGQKMLFMLPGLIIALVLAIGISYWILYVVNTKTEEKLDLVKTELETKNNKLGEELKKLDSANKELQKELAETKEKAGKLEEKARKLTDELTKISKGLDDVAALDLSNFMKQQKGEQTEQNKEITGTKEGLSKLDRRVVYIEQRLEKIKELEADINGLKDTTGTLKKDLLALKADAVELSKKQKITEEDLTALDERARMFQLRVLAARAREAAEAARQMDLKTLLSRLDDVEEKK